MSDRNEATDNTGEPPFAFFAKRVLFVLLIAALALMAWSIVRLLLAVFAGLLLSVLLRNLSRMLGNFLPIQRWASLSLVVVIIVLAIVVAFSLFGAQLAQQFQRLIEALPVAREQIESRVEESEIVQFLMTQMEDIDPIAVLGQGLVGQVTNLAFTTLEAVVGFLVILLIAVYLSFSPDFYREGIVRLAPVRHRARTREVLLGTDDLLWKWLIGQVIAMIFVGTFTTIGLVLLDVPMALALGLLTGLLNFVPVLGPIMASVPAIMVSFIDGPMLALYVLFLYVVVQQVETFVVVPVVQRWAVSLPPALAVLSAIGAGVLFGIPGVMLAVPLTVMIMGLVNMIYVETLLEGKGESAQEGSAPAQEPSELGRSEEKSKAHARR
jgi:predicted PurR-regulated permease PerM